MHRIAGAVLINVILIVGCTKSPEVIRYELSGSVTYNSSPVELGEIRITPDYSAGNSGPAVVVRIVDGKYKTLANKGPVGGPHVIRIFGQRKVEEPLTVVDGPPRETKVLFRNYEIRVDLPPEDSTLDFEVPTQKAESPPRHTR